MTIIKAIKETAEAVVTLARPVCPKWLIALIVVCAFIPLDPFDEIVPAIPVAIILWRNPEVWRDIKAAWSMIWLEGVAMLCAYGAAPALSPGAPTLAGMATVTLSSSR